MYFNGIGNDSSLGMHSLTRGPHDAINENSCNRPDIIFSFRIIVC